MRTLKRDKCALGADNGGGPAPVRSLNIEQRGRDAIFGDQSPYGVYCVQVLSLVRVVKGLLPGEGVPVGT
jgi:hypothetical protein